MVYLVIALTIWAGLASYQWWVWKGVTQNLNKELEVKESQIARLFKQLNKEPE